MKNKGGENSLPSYFYIYDAPIKSIVDSITDGGIMDVTLVCTVSAIGNAFDEAGCASNFYLSSKASIDIVGYET